jgi:hypothetical protein
MRQKEKRPTSRERGSDSRMPFAKRLCVGGTLATTRGFTLAACALITPPTSTYLTPHRVAFVSSLA